MQDTAETPRGGGPQRFFIHLSSLSALGKRRLVEVAGEMQNAAKSAKNAKVRKDFFGRLIERVKEVLFIIPFFVPHCLGVGSLIGNEGRAMGKDIL